MRNAPTASIVVPTRLRPDYLEWTLSSVVPQSAGADTEVLVVSDGPDARAVEIAGRHGARLIALSEPQGANAARNAGAAAATGELVVFVDDDIEALPGWLEALLRASEAAPDHDVFGGPIRARLEGGGPRPCGREPAPITTLDLGADDRDVAFVWSANMAIRKRALARVGRFDETIQGRGEEEEWQRRYAADGGRVRYVAGAGIVHRRNLRDSAAIPLARAAYGYGRTARRYDMRKGTAPSIAGELRTLVGCIWHTVRRRCGYGIVFTAQTLGRLREALTKSESVARVPAEAPPNDFFSGTSGQVFGIRRTSVATVGDAIDDAVALALLERWRLTHAARSLPRRRVLALAVERTDQPNLLAHARTELLRSRHGVTFTSTPAGHGGKFQNLNALLAGNPVDRYDWLIALDDDVSLPTGFLDSFLFLAERFRLALAQPAHRQRSHAAWQVTRRRRASVVRETAFVEIGPLCAFHRSTFDELLPFPELRFGWGLDLHWSALARERGWRLGVVDATPVQHGLRRIASSYSRDDAVAEARAFLTTHQYTPASVAQQTLATHRTWWR
jgi:GT2 family glycosyltransferase